MRNNIFRNGKVHVCARMCDTCVFRPGNLMHLEEGRVKEMVTEATRDNSTIVCHESLGTETHTACRGFADRHATQPLQVALRLGFVEYVQPASFQKEGS